MKNEALWRQTIKSWATKESWEAQRKWIRAFHKALFNPLGLAPKAMEILGEIPDLVEKPEADPSILSQLRSAKRADPLNIPLLTEALFEAQRKAPNASQGTQRKWRKALGFG